MRVYKRRTPNDDGWMFHAAKSKQAACKFFGTDAVSLASLDDLHTLACRALTGNF
jgi:hypothetical protein